MENVDTRAYIQIPGLVYLDGSPMPLPLDVDEWYVWQRKLLAVRAKVIAETSDGAPNRDMARAVHKAFCRQPGAAGFLYWLAMFGMILEPRNDADRVVEPYVPWPRQAELAEAICDVMAQPGEGRFSSLLVEKARAVGATWMDAAHNAWMWQFSPFFNALVISRTEEQVDSKGDPSSYFWKMEFLLKQQPDWLLPQGFDFDKHRLFRKLTNPETGSVITGATTTEDAGRAGRYTKVTIDEGAFVDGFGAIWNNLANVTYHRFTYSSANTRNGLDFYNLRFGRDGYTSPRVFTFRWDQVPGRDLDWRQRMKESMKEDEFQREVELNYLAGSGEWVYPMAQTIEVGHYPFVPGWPTRVIIDDGYDDDFAIIWLQKDVVHRRIRVVAAYANSHKPLRFYGHLMTGQPSTEFRWTGEELQLMGWLREFSVYNAVYYGDRHGDNTDLSSGKSPFQVLAEEFGIVVITTGDPTQNSLKHRRDAAAELIPRLDIDERHGAPLVLEALRYARFPRKRDGSQPTGEFKGPIHDSTSHFRSAFEYFAINDRLEFAAAGYSGERSGPLQRATISGFKRSPSNSRYGAVAKTAERVAM